MVRIIIALVLLFFTTTATAGNPQYMQGIKAQQAQTHDWRSTIASDDLLNPEFEMNEEYRLLLLRREFAGMKYALEEQQQVIKDLLSNRAEDTNVIDMIVSETNPFSGMSPIAAQALEDATRDVLRSLNLIMTNTTDDSTRQSLSDLVDRLTIELNYFREITGNVTPKPTEPE